MCNDDADTRGDSSMLGTGMGFVVVGNGSQELLDDVAAAGRPHLHRVAEAPFGHGVVEGLRAFRREGRRGRRATAEKSHHGKSTEMEAKLCEAREGGGTGKRAGLYSA